MARTIILAELTARTDYSTGTTTLRYGTAGYMTRPTDTPANTYYDGRISQPAMLRQELPRDFVGQAVTAYGEMVLSNADGLLGDLFYLGLDGQQLRLLQGDADSAYSSFTEVFKATMEQAIFDRNTVRIRLKDPTQLFNRPLLGTFYAGNNSLPAGLEGNADDLKGRPKPRLYGVVLNLPPPCVNTTRLIYQAHEGSYPVGVFDVTAVYDRGASMTRGADYTNQADMETNAPAAGQYRAWTAGGMFRIGTTPVGLITCDASNGQYYTWDEILKAVAADVGFSGGTALVPEINSPDWPPDNWGVPPTAGVDAQLGVWVQDTRTAREVMDVIAESAGVWYGWAGSNASGVMRMRAAVFPYPFSLLDTSAVITIGADAILQARPMVGQQDGAGIPAWRVDMGWQPILEMQTFDVDAGVNTARRSFLANERRRLSSSDSAIKNKHAAAITVVRNTQIQNEAGAVDEAARVLELLRYRKLWLELVVRGDGFTVGGIGTTSTSAVAAFALGKYVKVTWPGLRVTQQSGTVTDYGYFTIIVLERDIRAGTVRLVVRQATEQTL